MSPRHRHARLCSVLKTRTVALALFLSSAIPIAGQTEEWHRYSNRDGNFSVLLPGEPKAIAVGTIEAKVGATSYMVVYQNDIEDHAVNEAEFKSYREFVLNGLKGSANCDVVDRDTPPSIHIRGYFGSLFHLNCHRVSKEWRMVGNIYMGQRHAYTVCAIFPTVTSDPPNVKKFINSFSLIDVNK